MLITSANLADDPQATSLRPKKPPHGLHRDNHHDPERDDNDHATFSTKSLSAPTPATLEAGAMSRKVHILWSAETGPICAYENGILAHAHAKTMLGVLVASVDLRTVLPEIARLDLAAEFDSQFEDETPVDEIPLDALDDAPRTVDPEQDKDE